MEGLNVKKRNETLDLIRGVAILIVILGHALLSAWADVPTENWLYELIINFQMALLMFISGIASGFSFPTEKNLEFIKKKAMRLLVPYLLWAELYACINTLACGGEWSIDIFISAVYASDFWFLRYLFVFYFVLFIVNLCYNAIKKYMKFVQGKEKLLLRTLLVMAFCIVFLLMKLPYIQYSVSMWYYFWFVLGIFVFEFLGWFRNNRVLFHAVGTAVIDIMVILLIAILVGGNVHKQIQGTIMVLGICYLCYFMRKILPTKVIEWFANIGKNTLPIYAVHWCIFFAPLYNCRVFTTLIQEYHIPHAVAVIIIFIYLLVCTMILTNILKKFKVTRVLLLGENK